LDGGDGWSYPGFGTKPYTISRPAQPAKKSDASIHNIRDL
jgi:hypothetical protein